LDDRKQGSTTHWHDVLIPCRADHRAVFGCFVSDRIVGVEAAQLQYDVTSSLERHSDDGSPKSSHRERPAWTIHDTLDIVHLMQSSIQYMTW